MSSSPLLRALIVCLTLTQLGACQCGSDVTIFETDGGTGRADGGTDGGTGTGGGTGTQTDGGRRDGGMVEICDGLDNDGDGIIDNVDVSGDGVCDCLKIATLGYRGTAGVGDVFNQWLNGKSVAGAVSLDKQTLTPSLLAAYQVIVIQNVRDGSKSGVGEGIGRVYAQSEVEALRAWVAAGGGVMTLIGYSDATEVRNVNLLLAPYNINYGTTQILSKVGGSTVPIVHWAVHPLTENIKKIGVDNGYEVRGDGGVVISYEPNPGAFDTARATPYGKGHVFVWCDEWITFNSEWTQHTDYQVERFWLNSLKWLTPVDQCQVALPVIN